MNNDKDCRDFRTYRRVNSPVGLVVTEDQYKVLVSHKAYELYQKRQAATHLEDWLEAERLVKTELLAEGRGSVQ